MVRAEKGQYVCEECGFHYKEKVWAEKCEAWDKKYHACSIEISRHSVEGGKK